MIDATVFLIDDDASVRDSLSLVLSLQGMRTQLFATAEAFLETYRPDWRGCVLTDLQMPGMSGLDLQQALRDRGISLPVVVLTAHGDVSTTRLAMKRGAFDFLEKPIDDGILLDVLQNAIREDTMRHDAQRTLLASKAYSAPGNCVTALMAINTKANRKMTAVLVADRIHVRRPPIGTKS